MKNLMGKDNLALLTCRQQTSFDFQHIFITNKISERCSVSLQTGELSYVFPLYVYPISNNLDLLANNSRTPNLSPIAIQQIAKGLKLTFTTEKTSEPNTFAPIDLLDYIYAILHSPSYRETYKEFLKTDFPRVPYPTDAAQFWQLVTLGGELRKTHLLERPVPIGSQAGAISYPVSDNHLVVKPRFELHGETGRVYINDTQYFEGVPELAWNFYIGGYQPAQKWLKDRKGRALNFEDILHYQKIIHALSETDRLMKSIDTVFTIH